MKMKDKLHYNDIIEGYGLRYIINIISAYRNVYQPLVRVNLQSNRSALLVGEACRLSRVYRLDTAIQSNLPHLYLGGLNLYRKLADVPFHERLDTVQNYKCNTPSWIHITGKIDNCTISKINEAYEFLMKVRLPQFVSVNYNLETGEKKQTKWERLSHQTKSLTYTPMGTDKKSVSKSH